MIDGPLAMHVALGAGLSIAGMLVGTVFSSLFSGLETGLYVLNKVRLSLKASEGSLAARRIEAALDDSGRMLATLLLGTNASNYMVTVSVVMMLESFHVRDVEFYCTALITPYLFIFGEMGPKNIFRKSAETSVYRFAGVLTASMRLLRWTGLSWLLDRLSRGLLRLLSAEDDAASSDALIPPAVRAYLAEGLAHGALTDDQHDMAHRVMELRGTSVGQVMTPRRDVVSVPLDCPRDQLVAALAGHDFSRLPVWEGRLTNVVGVVNVNRLLCDEDPDVTPRRHMTEPVWLEGKTPVSRSLLDLQKSRHTMAFIRDSRGRFAGIVTLKDLVEEIVGDLPAW